MLQKDYYVANDINSKNIMNSCVVLHEDEHCSSFIHYKEGQELTEEMRDNIDNYRYCRVCASESSFEPTKQEVAEIMSIIFRDEEEERMAG